MKDVYRIGLFFVLLICLHVESARCLGQDEMVQLLLSETAELRKEISSVKLKQVKLEHENKELRSKIENMLGSQTSPHNDKAKRLLMSISEIHKKAAFSAGLSNHVSNLGRYQTIVFDDVFTNDGNVYSPMTGVFTSPRNGTYYFSATVMSLNGEYLETEISLNGKSLVYMYSSDSKYEQGTNSIVLALKGGDMVWVRHQGSEGNNVHGNHWSTFSGFQIS